MFDSKVYREINKDKIKNYQKRWRKKNAKYFKAWKKANPNYFKEYGKIYFAKEEVKISQRMHQRNWAKRNRKKVLEYRKQTLPKLAASMRNNVYRLIKFVCLKKELKSFEYFGCSPGELKLHIEKQFKPGMSWDNHGVWHIDHIIPLASFTKKTIMKANHYTNLQPLWAKENLAKNRKTHNQ